MTNYTSRAKSDKKRCWWCGQDELYVNYHDREWGVPVYDDRRLFEFLILEGAQAGLSWSTILKKRQAYVEAFDAFDPHKVARYSPSKVERLLQNPGIVRNRLKVASAVGNARAYLKLLDEFDTFSDYQWRFVDGRPRVNSWRKPEQVPSQTTISDQFSKDLRSRGFKFVGSTIMYAHMQAVGMVNDHLVSCFRHDQLV
jgi:DNA-3-methyladenine glycosylase I